MPPRSRNCDFAISQLSAAMRSRRSSSVGVRLALSDFHDVNSLNLSASVALCGPISWMRALAAASSCLSVAISAAAATVRSTIIASISRGRADRALPPSGLAKIFGDAVAVLSLHWLVFDNRLAQRPIQSDEFVTIVAVALVEQRAQRLQR